MTTPARPSEAALALAVAEADPERLALAEALVADWLREAGTGAHREAILGTLWDDWGRAIAGRDAAGRLAVLQAEVVERRVRALGRRAFELGRQVIDQVATVAVAARGGHEILAQLDQVGAEVEAVLEPERRAVLRRRVGEARVDAEFAVTRECMSERLAQYHAQQAARG